MKKFIITTMLLTSLTISAQRFDNLPDSSPTDRFYEDVYLPAPEEEKAEKLLELVEISNQYNSKLNEKRHELDPMEFYERIYSNMIVVSRAFVDYGKLSNAESVINNAQYIFGNTYLEILLEDERCNLIDRKNDSESEWAIDVNKRLTLAKNHPEFMRHPDPHIRAHYLTMLRNLAVVRAKLNDPEYPASPIYQEYFDIGLSENLFILDTLTDDWAQFVAVARKESYRIPASRTMSSSVQNAIDNFGQNGFGLPISKEDRERAIEEYNEEMLVFINQNLTRFIDKE